MNMTKWPVMFCLLPILFISAAGYARNGEPSLLKAARQTIKYSPINRSMPMEHRLTLQECLELALANNGLIGSHTYALEAARTKVERAKAIGKPVLDYEYQTAPIPSDLDNSVANFFQGELSWLHKLKIGVGVPLYTFGKLDTAKNLANQGVEAEKYRYLKEKVGVTSKIRQLYYGIQFAENLSDLLAEAIDKLTGEINKEVNMEENDEESSSLSPVEKLKIKLFRADLERRLTEARRKEMLALVALRVQMGLQHGAQIGISDLTLRPERHELKSLDDYFDILAENRPDLHLVKTGLRAKRLELDLEKKNYFPDLGAGAFFEIGRTTSTIQGVTATDDFSDPFNFTRAGVGLRLKGKIDFYGISKKINQLESEYYKSSLEASMAAEGIKLEVRDAYQKVKDNYIETARSDESQKTARAMMFLTKSNADLGIGEKSEYADALQAVLLSRGRYMEAVFNYNISLAELDEKLGVLPAREQALESSKQ